MSFSIEIIKGEEGRGDDSWAREVKFRNQKYFSFDGINVVSVESFLDDYESRRMELGSSSIQNSVDNIARFGWYDRRYVDVTLRP